MSITVMFVLNADNDDNNNKKKHPFSHPCWQHSHWKGCFFMNPW